MAVETPIQVLLLIYPTFNTLDLNGPLDVLRNGLSCAPILASVLSKPMPSPSPSPPPPLSPLPTKTWPSTVPSLYPMHRENLSNYDVLLQVGGLASGINPHLTSTDEIILLIQKFSCLGYSPRLGDLRIMMSICTGALFFGYAGVFAGLEATTHYLSLDNLKHACQEYNVRAPGSKVTTVVPNPPDSAFRYVKIQVNVEATARVISSGGISWGLDATLYLVSLLVGRDFGGWDCEG